MNEEIRQALRAARPSGQDEQDPAVVEARMAVSQDPSLAASLEAERLADGAFAQALQSAEPPHDLAPRILDALRALPREVVPPEGIEEQLMGAVRAAAGPSSAVPPAAPATANRRRWLMTAAASAAALAFGGWAWRRRRPPRMSMGELVAELAALSSNGVTLSLMTMDKAAIRSWMEVHQAPRVDPIPPAMDALGRKGCHLYQIAGHPVSLECFMAASGAILHLFCTNSPRLTDPPAEGAAPRIETQHGHTVAVWTREGRTLLLLCHEPEESVRALVL